MSSSEPGTGHADTADIGDLRMYYEIHGEGRPLLLLHGAYMTVDMLDPLRAGLATSREVIAPELRGHGHTGDGEGPITYERMADDCAALLRHLDRAPADVMGFSMGGGAALQLAIRHPDVVRRLVVASASFASDGMPEVARTMFPDITPEMFAGTPMEETYQRTSPHPDAFPRFVQKMKELDTAEFSWPEDDIRAMAAPTMVVLGDSDGITLEHAVRLFQLRGGGVMGDLEGMPRAQLAVLPATSHFMPAGSGVLDRSGWLLEMIPPFLDATD
jgi:pimeloyl-ACP methyl ester carboxylesterase